MPDVQVSSENPISDLRNELVAGRGCSTECVARRERGSNMSYQTGSAVLVVLLEGRAGALLIDI